MKNSAEKKRKLYLINYLCVPYANIHENIVSRCEGIYFSEEEAEERMRELASFDAEDGIKFGNSLDVKHNHNERRIVIEDKEFCRYEYYIQEFEI